MKYLKLFEDIFSTNDYYSEISADEWTSFLPSSMTDDHINKIKKMCNKKLVVREMRPPHDDIASNPNSLCNYLAYHKKYVDKVTTQVLFRESIDLYEYKDEEWFIIKYVIYDWDKQIDKMNIVKCDGIDGLLRFFKDKKLLK